MRRAGPLDRADRIVTPTLLIHSEDDYRCPISQAEQLFAALALRGVEVEMLRFPGEGHELSRSGTPRHRIERFHAILDWHDRHLAGRGEDVAD
jgi:dipeptidyl aminopeptidase/acylaminoacyl peptidase